MLRTFCAALLCSAAAPAFAGELPRLVPGATGSAAFAEWRTQAAAPVTAEMYAHNGLRLGAMVAPVPGEPVSGGTGVGGFASYNLNSFTLGSSLRSGDDAGIADLSASYAADFGTTILTLGYGWSGFTPSPQIVDSQIPAASLSLGIGFQSDLSSALQLGGYAAAIRSQYEDRPTQQGFRVGATLGWRF